MDEVDFVAAALSTCTPRLMELLGREITGDRVLFMEARLLGPLMNGPRRITELAGRQGLTQLTATVLVKQLEEDGLVMRNWEVDDQQVALVSITNKGAALLARILSQARDVLRGYVDRLSEDDLRALADAMGPLQHLVGMLDSPPS
jgi:DNA-binding MarR family transcriptional regulator